MGNALKKENFAYDIGEQYASNFIWTLHRGVRKADGLQVTIFCFNLNDKNSEKVDYARTTLKRYKTIRHPSIIKWLEYVFFFTFLFSFSGAEIGEMMYLVTEYVTLLPDMLVNSFVEIGYNELKAWGVYSIIVRFLQQFIFFLASNTLFTFQTIVSWLFIE